ncbi:helix-turn-helix transcriptional regulator [Pseudorhodoferax sp. LjRoot39]|uniref:helix-turn-helix transcriptional regulator n=1 Tax=Pseudorhodoferax sp. LjRoot39 TaxID=3342328 RepID=UPI003ED08619
MQTATTGPERETVNANAEAPWGGDAVLAALLAGLDRCAHGMALLDAEGQAWFANTSARALFKRLAGDADADPQRLRWPSDRHAALAKVCGQGRRELVELRLPKGSVSVALLPVSLPDRQLAFALFGREEICGPVELQQFALRHQLTLAETQVLGALCKGLAANDIALVHGVARTTVLTQIAAIRTKTGSPSVRALLAMISRMPQLVPLMGVVH